MNLVHPPNFEAASFVEAEWTKQEVFTGVSGLGQKVAEYMWLFATTRCTNSLQQISKSAFQNTCCKVCTLSEKYIL